MVLLLIEMKLLWLEILCSAILFQDFSKFKIFRCFFLRSEKVPNQCH